MTRRRFATQTPKQSSSTLADSLGSGRLPLDLALAVAGEIVNAVASAHQQQQAFGALSASDFVVQPDGSIALTAAPLAGAEVASNTFDVGAVLYQVFTGLTPKQARAQLRVSPLHDVPPAGRVNPALDESIEHLLGLMLDRDPARRPHSLRVIEALLDEVFEALELEPSRAAILAWASVKPALQVVEAPAPVPAPAPVVVKKTKHVPTFAMPLEEGFDSDEDEDEEVDAPYVPGGFRFDMWMAAAAAFCVVAFTMATKL